jgi:hypothetical protein
MIHSRFSPKTPDPFMLAVLSILSLVSVARAQETEKSTDETRNSEQQARLRAAEEHVGQIDMQVGRERVKRVERPLLVYGDSARDNADGTLWAWGNSGRPLAVLETYFNTKAGGQRANAITLTGRDLVVAKTPTAGSTLWQPQQVQIEAVPFPDAPETSAKQAVRTRQLKELARRITAHEFWDPDNSRFELRLLVQPVHRYVDEDAQIHDGAMFVLAHGTNPEVLVLIEALGESIDTARWHCSLARLGSAEMHVAIDGKEVWTAGRTPGVVGKPTDPYWLFMTAPDKPPEPKE